MNANPEAGEAGEAVVFTVFTPTYNRADILERVYESLCAQTMRGFEWLIVDDGSTDHTEDRVKGWIEAGRIAIRYLKQPNQGKHIAINKGVEHARGELFLIFDSDDRCKPRTLERFLYHWNSIPEEERKRFTGATCLCEDEDGRLVGDPFPSDVTDSDSAEIRFRHGVTGEKWGFHRTEVLRQFPFPSVEKAKGYNYVPEGIVWLKIASVFKTRYFNETLRIYYRNDSGESLMRSTRPLAEEARGAMDMHREILDTQWRFFWAAPLEFIRSGVHYGRFSRHARVPLSEAVRRLGTWKTRLLVLLVFPVSLALERGDAYAERQSKLLKVSVFRGTA